MVFACLEGAVWTQHTYTEEEWEAFEAGIQGAMVGSGINYNPWRIYTEDDLQRAANSEAEVKPSTYTPRVLVNVRAMS